MKKIFLDNNATTPLDPRVITAIIEELEKSPSNPSSIHSFGRSAKARLIKGRSAIAEVLEIDPNELIFTSGGTESINFALLGLSPSHLITSPIEHPALLKTIERMGCPTTYLPIDSRGHIDLQDLEQELTLHPSSVIALGAVNSETGIKNPLTEIANLALEFGALLIVDAVALLGKEPLSIPKGVSAMAFSSHKTHGPKGVGALFVRKDLPLSPLITGGGQEKELRAGTENLPGIIGFAKAISLLQEELPNATKEMERLRNLFESSLPFAQVNGNGPRVCNTSNLTFPHTDGEGLLIALDLKGIAASMGSACSAGSIAPSKVLMKMGRSKMEALSSLRFSLSRFTTQAEIDQAIRAIRHFCRCTAP